MPNFWRIRRWRNLKLDICTRVYSISESYTITYGRVRIVYDKSYRVDRPVMFVERVVVAIVSACANSSYRRYSMQGIRRQQEFYSLPKRYKQIQRFEQRLFFLEGLCLKRRICLYRLGSE